MVIKILEKIAVKAGGERMLRRFKIERPHDNVASGQHPEGMNPVGVRGRKFQEEGTVGARGHAKCVGET